MPKAGPGSASLERSCSRSVSWTWYHTQDSQRLSQREIEQGEGKVPQCQGVSLGYKRWFSRGKLPESLTPVRAQSRHLATFANSSRSPAAIRPMPGPLSGCPTATSPVLSTIHLSGTRMDRREKAGPCHTPVFLSGQQNEE